MLFKTRSAAVYGIEAYLVDVEVNISTGGNGQVVIVGLPDTAVRESKNRVLPAIRNNGFGAPYQRIVINLGPADVKKEGSAFDLPMAIGILGGYGLLAKQDVSDYLMVGELTLDGKLRPVKGVLSIAMLARDRKIPHLLVPAGNAQEAAVVEGVAVYPVRTLTEVVEFVNGTRFIDPVRSENQPVTQESHRRHEDFRDVRGQYHAKRAIEVAMAGGHMLSVWPQARRSGSWKKFVCFNNGVRHVGRDCPDYTDSCVPTSVSLPPASSSPRSGTKGCIRPHREETHLPKVRGL